MTDRAVSTVRVRVRHPDVVSAAETQAEMTAGATAGMTAEMTDAVLRAADPRAVLP